MASRRVSFADSRASEGAAGAAATGAAATGAAATGAAATGAAADGAERIAPASASGASPAAAEGGASGALAAAGNAEPAESEGARLWREDMTRMELGTRLLFVNDFGGAESVFRSGMNNARSAEALAQQRRAGSRARAGEPVRDLRGAFALQYALVSVIKGVASLANDQLDECLQRLWFAEELAAGDDDWLGKDVVRGIVTLVGGVIQCLQHSFVKGVFNVLKSWLWIKVLQREAVSFKGKERSVVRSCALLTLGIFNLLLSLLPDSMLSAATFLSGFQGDRRAGLRMLLECWKEGGVFSPWGALVWAAYNVDTKSFLDEKLSAGDLRDLSAIFRWAAQAYPNSVFFSGIEADFEACRRKVGLAHQIIDRAAPYAGELKALEWALNYKRGVYELVELGFARAGQYFEASLEVYVRVGRRSMVPFMAIYAFLCYHVVADHRGRIERARDEHAAERAADFGSGDGSPQRPAGGAGKTPGAAAHDGGGSEHSGEARELEEELGEAEEEEEEGGMDASTAAAHADEMLALVHKYSKMAKGNWGRQDRYAFGVFRKYDAWNALASDSVERLLKTQAGEPWPLLDLVESMIVRMRCTRWMDAAQAAHLLELLQTEAALREPDPNDEVRLCFLFSQILMERDSRDPALEWTHKGLALAAEDLSAEGRTYLPLLLYLKALNMYQRGQLLSAKHCLARLDDAKLDEDETWVANYILFKSNVLRKLIAADSRGEKDYSSADVPAGEAHQIVLPAPSSAVVSWDWNCQAHDIQFSAIFRPADGSDIAMLSSIERHAAESGPVVGSYCTTRPGDVIFQWDNRYSFMRKKHVIYRVRSEEPAPGTESALDDEEEDEDGEDGDYVDHHQHESADGGHEHAAADHQHALRNAEGEHVPR